MRTFLVLVALASFGCGQTTPASDGGADGQALDVFTSGCSMGSTKVYEYDPKVCTAQLDRAMSCNGSICNWSVIIPCTATNDAGTDADADAGDGGVDCHTICNDVQPPDPHSPPGGFCQTTTSGSVTTITCGGCGV